MKKKDYLAPQTSEHLVTLGRVMVVEGSFNQRFQVNYDDEEDPDDPNGARFGHFQSVWDE